MNRFFCTHAAVFVGIILTTGASEAQNQNVDFFMSESPAARSGRIGAADPDWQSVMFRIYGARKDDTDGRWILDDAE